MTRRSKMWYFDVAPSGHNVGFNDAGQEFFRDDYWDKAVREMIQNSLDASISTDKTVQVTMRLMEVAPEDISARDLIRHFKKAAAAADGKSKEYHDNALTILRGSSIDVLAVTDYNTTGLKGDAWDALVYGEGTTHKNNRASGGSFGIGKSSSYVASNLRTVFYYTSYPEDDTVVEKLIGRCRSVTHEDPDDSSKKLFHIGFCISGSSGTDVSENNMPVRDGMIPKKFRIRHEGGSTTVFIIGFRQPGQNWVSMAAWAVARNFFIAVMNKKLSVKIVDKDGSVQNVSADTLAKIFSNHADSHERQYYETAVNPQHQKSISGDFGKFTMMFSTRRNNSPNRIAYVNRRGMLITDARQFSKNPFYSSLGDFRQYCALIQAYDDKTDEKIRRMEPPNHNEIACGRIDDEIDRKAIKKQLDVIREEIKNILNEFLAPLPSERINPSELASLIPMKNPMASSDLRTSVTVSEKKSEFGPAGSVVGVTIRPEPRTPREKRHVEERQSGTPKNRPTPEGRRRGSIFSRSRVKRHGDTLRVWLSLAREAGTLTFCISASGEQAINEDYITPSGVKPVSPADVSVSVDGHMVTVDSPPVDLVFDIDVGRTVAYCGYVVHEVSNRLDSVKGTVS